MANRKVKKPAEVEVEVKVSDEEITTPIEEAVEETPVIEVIEEAINVNESAKPETLCRVRMRVDHKCTIAGENYLLFKDGVYNVPANVKRILNEAGLLAPL